MRWKRVKIDSLNLRDEQMESIFIYHQDYTIEAVKTKSVFKPKIWSEAFGKPLAKMIKGRWVTPIMEAKIIHTCMGLKIPLKTFTRTPKSQTVEFAGLHGYNERSRHLLQHLQGLKSQLQYTGVMRVDVAIDFNGRIPKRIIANLTRHREPFRYGNTTYYKTAKEKKTNQRMDIKIYNKQIQAKLDYPLHRLEFVFKGSYFNKLLFKDLETVYKKMEKSIKKATGLSVQIEAI